MNILSITSARRQGTSFFGSWFLVERRHGCWFASLLMMLGTLGHAAEEKLFCYVSVGGEKQIVVYRVDASSGRLTAAHRVSVDGTPGSLAVDPSRRYLYAGLGASGSVASFRINRETGALDPIGTARIEGNPTYVVTDRAGKFLLTSYYSDAKAAFHRIGPDGAVQAGATQVVATEKNPHSIQTDPTNRFLFIPNTGSDVVLQYRWDAATGTVKPNEPPKLIEDPADGPRHFYFHPKRDLVYFVNEKSSTVTACRLDRAKGLLSVIEKVPTLPAGFGGKNSTADIEITPDGWFLYASNRGHDSLAGYAIDSSTGRLTSLGNFPTEQTPRDFNIEPGGRFVYSAGQGNGKLAAYKIDPKTGALSQFATYEVGKGPGWVLAVSLGK